MDKAKILSSLAALASSDDPALPLKMLMNVGNARPVWAFRRKSQKKRRLMRRRVS